MSAAPPAVGPSCFVTGTDTGVGKTLVASALVAALARALGPRGVRVAGMKALAAGAVQRDGEWVNEDVEMLRAAANVPLARAEVCPCVLPEAVAPHIAAELAGVRIELPAIVEAYRALRRRAEVVIVEGVGGFRVPLGSGVDTGDLAVALGLPVVLVVGLRLGCLNHAILTAEAIEARGLRLCGWVANTIDPRMGQVERNLAALQQMLPAPCLGRIPWLPEPRPDAALGLLDLRALLASLR